MENRTLDHAVQHILVFQQNGSGENKIKGLKAFGGDRFTIERFNIDGPLPPVIDDSSDFLPDTLSADLVLDYLKHLDLSNDLWLLCEKLGIPVVASNKKTMGLWALTPRVCCALPRQKKLRAYGQCFGLPEFQVRIEDGLIADISVLHGAPCGATWEAARRTIGIPVEDAPMHLGLKTQFYCTANPAGWDVLYGKSPVHYAAELHQAALKHAIHRCLRST